MQITFDCPHCGVEIEADSEFGGDHVACPACSNVLLVPAAGITAGTILGGFEVVKRLGVGGMGEVFLARQLTMDRIVALKVLPPAMTKNKGLLERFLHEVRMSGKLEHPNIVTAFDAGTDGGYHYLAMSYINGHDLDERIERERRLSEDDGLRIVYHVADALDYAWTTFKMLHRDIKPSNIMVDAANDIKLMDMGIAKSIAEDSNLTMAGLFVGTPYYMSPEQAKSASDIDFRADIYSLGATLYHLVTGTRPFDGPSSVAILSKHLSEPLIAPNQRNTQLSTDVNQLIVRMMAKDRDARHASWQSLMADVTAIRQRISRASCGDTVVVESTDGQPGTLVPLAPSTLDGSPGSVVGLSGTIVSGNAVRNASPSPSTAAVGQTKPSDAVTISIPAMTDISPTVRRLIVGAVVIGGVLVAWWFGWGVYSTAKENQAKREAEREQRQVQAAQTQQAGESDLMTNLHRIQAQEEAKVAAAAQEKHLAAMLTYAQRYVLEHPHDVDGALINFREISEQGRGTPYQLQASQHIRELEQILADEATCLAAMRGRWRTHRHFGAVYDQQKTPKTVEFTIGDGNEFAMRMDNKRGRGTVHINRDSMYLVLPGKTPRRWTFTLSGEELTLSPEADVYYALHRIKPTRN